jgi:negative regulator of sigma E activity
MEPNLPRNELRQQQQQNHELAQTQGLQSTQGKEFSSVEEMLRFDAAQNPPPEAIRNRLEASVEAEPAPQKPWWKRWFGGGDQT